MKGRKAIELASLARLQEAGLIPTVQTVLQLLHTVRGGKPVEQLDAKTLETLFQILHDEELEKLR
jgi:hypothetical protein